MKKVSLPLIVALTVLVIGGAVYAQETASTSKESVQPWKMGRCLRAGEWLGPNNADNQAKCCVGLGEVIKTGPALPWMDTRGHCYYMSNHEASETASTTSEKIPHSYGQIASTTTEKVDCTGPETTCGKVAFTSSSIIPPQEDKGKWAIVMTNRLVSVAPMVGYKTAIKGSVAESGSVSLPIKYGSLKEEGTFTKATTSKVMIDSGGVIAMTGEKVAIKNSLLSVAGSPVKVSPKQASLIASKKLASNDFSLEIKRVKWAGTYKVVYEGISGTGAKVLIDAKTARVIQAK
ncbi:MAG: hypothetical protein WCO03_01135 [bacterium]